MKRLLFVGALMMAVAAPALAQTTPTAPPASVALPAATTAPPAPPPVIIPAPDYNTDAGWLCLPGRQDACTVDQNVTVITAEGKRKVVKFKADPAPRFDCFYVYPTVSLDPRKSRSRHRRPRASPPSAGSMRRSIARSH
jgi:hypothetical protein